jgi:hypothetical protein
MDKKLVETFTRRASNNCFGIAAVLGALLTEAPTSQSLVETTLEVTMAACALRAVNCAVIENL